MSWSDVHWVMSRPRRWLSSGTINARGSPALFEMSATDAVVDCVLGGRMWFDLVVHQDVPDVVDDFGLMW